MSAWGKGGIARSCDSLIKKVEQNDPRLVDLVILSNKDFGAKEVERLAKTFESGGNTNLRTFSASGHALSTESLTRLGCAIAQGKCGIKRLALGDNDMGDAGVCALCDGFSQAEGFKLEAIDLSWKGFGAKGMQKIVEVLGKSQTLRTLIVSRNEKIGSENAFSESVGGASSFPGLREFDISESKLTAEACIGLAQTLKPIDHDRTMILRLNSNSIGPEGVETLCPLIEKAAIAELHLEHCDIGDKGLEHLVSRATAIAEVALQVLNVTSNGISPAGLNLFASKLEDGSAKLAKLEDLNLSNNSLDEQSMQSFASTIGALQSENKIRLQKMDLTGTSCGVQGASDIIKYGQLKELRLFNNKLSSAGFVQIGEQLQGGHPTLEMLDLGGNGADEASVVSLLRSLTTKGETAQSALKILIVGGNCTGPSVESMVKEVLVIFPDLDIARDKPAKPGGGEQNYPPGFPSELINR